MNKCCAQTQTGEYKTIVYIICLSAALGGLLFGLDQGFIANSVETIKSQYGLNTTGIEKYSAILAIGGIVGASLSGFLSRFLGRKKSLVLAGVIFSFGSLLSALLPSIGILTVLRFTLGFGVGLASFVAPLYLSETAPAAIRGAMGTLFQLMITIGIFLISVSNVLLSSYFTDTRIALPLMFLVITLFAILMLVTSIFLPESPRWLMLKGKKNEAIQALQQTLNNQNEVTAEIQEIEKILSMEKPSIRNTISLGFIKVLLIGIALQMFQQLVGINMMIYYTPTIFGYAGMKGLVATMTVPTVNMLFTFPAIFLVEKWGRKKLLYFGALFMLLTMLVAGLAFQYIGNATDPTLISSLPKHALLIAIIFYIFGFAISWGPVVWLVCSEIFPLQGREIGMTVTTIVNWTFAGLVMRYALSFMETYGNHMIFYVFSIFCVLAIIFVYKFVPETKGLTLEKLEIQLNRK